MATVHVNLEATVKPGTFIIRRLSRASGGSLSWFPGYRGYGGRVSFSVAILALMKGDPVPGLALPFFVRNSGGGKSKELPHRDSGSGGVFHS